MNRRIIIIIVIIILLVGGFFLYRSFQNQQAAMLNQFQTVPIARGNLTAIIGGTGTVRANQTAVLTWQTTGQVGEVYAGVDQQVEEGEVLAELNPRSLPQNIILAEAELVTARRDLENLRTSEVARAQARVALEQAQQALEDAQDKRTNKDYRRSSEATLAEAEANLILARDALEQAQDTYGSVADRDQNDVIRAQALSILSNAQRNYDRALANYNYLLSTPDEQEVEEADAELELAQANLAAAEREWERLQDGADPDDIAAAEARVASIEATLEQTRLRAPFGGTVTIVQTKPGDQVAPGTAAFRIDDLSRRLVDVEVAEIDINQIRVGQKATLSFDAIPNQEYEGSVIEVGRVATTPLTEGLAQAQTGAVNFTVTIELSSTDETVLPGMTAAVNIITNEVEDVLLVPNRAVRLREGQRVVYVLRDNMPVAEEIELGNTADTYSELASGNLQVGELIILNPPSLPTGGGAMFGGP